MVEKSGKGTARQSFRYDPVLWEKFGEAAQALGAERSAILRDFIDWYMRKPGAKLPERPPRVRSSDDSPSEPAS